MGRHFGPDSGYTGPIQPEGETDYFKRMEAAKAELAQKLEAVEARNQKLDGYQSQVALKMGFSREQGSNIKKREIGSSAWEATAMGDRILQAFEYQGEWDRQSNSFAKGKLDPKSKEYAELKAIISSPDHAILMALHKKNSELRRIKEDAQKQYDTSEFSGSKPQEDLEIWKNIQNL